MSTNIPKMRHKKIFLIFPFFCFLMCVTSCGAIGTIYLDLSVDRSFKQALYFNDTVNNREVIILPMTHVGSQKHYDRVKRYLDKMKEEGFVTFYEGVDLERDSLGKTDMPKNDTLKRKLRKVLGFDAFSGYDNLENKSLPKSLRRGKYIQQTVSNLGLVTDKDFNVDMKLGQIIDKYESEYKPIILTEYDWQTDLLQPYKRENSKEHSMYALLNYHRSDYIVEQVLASQHPKIIVVYGASHRWFINGPLQKAGFVWDRKFTLKDFK